MTADEPHAAEDVMKNGESGCEALDARIKAQYFAMTWQITVRAKVDTYDGEPSVKVTRVQACRCTACCDLAQDGGTGRFLSQTGLPLLVARRPSTST